MRKAIEVSDLAQITGEVLPERTVMSTVTTPFNNAGGDGGDGGSSSSGAAAAAGGGDGGSDGSTAINGQQGTVSQGTPGLLGSLGLGSNNPGSTLSSSPGAISGH